MGGLRLHTSAALEASAAEEPEDRCRSQAEAVALKIPLRLLSAVRGLREESLGGERSSTHQADVSPVDTMSATEVSAASAVAEAAENGADSRALNMPPEAAMAMLGGEEPFAPGHPRSRGSVVWCKPVIQCLPACKANVFRP